MLVLGIETTCDETAAAVVKDGKEILSNIVFSQVLLHKKMFNKYIEVIEHLVSSTSFSLLVTLYSKTKYKTKLH